MSIKKIKKVKIKMIGSNVNGNIYTKEALEKAIKDNGNKPSTGGLGQECIGRHITDGFDISKIVCFTSNLIIEDNFMKGDIEILNNMHGKILLDCFEHGRFGPAFSAKIKENVVINPKLISIDFIQGDKHK